MLHKIATKNNFACVPHGSGDLNHNIIEPYYGATGSRSKNYSSLLGPVTTDMRFH